MARSTARRFLFFGAGALLVLVWLLYFLRLHDPALPALVYAGWAVMAGGYVLIFLSIRTLRRQGKPKAGQDFAHTTRLIEHGIYAAVRHPLYLGWLLMYGAAMFVSQHWLVLILALLGSGCVYGIARLEELDLVKRFGSAYEQYMRSVPGMNLLTGIWRRARR